jgi:hypothetical protein
LFNIGATSTGWAAVSNSGIVVVVSDYRVRVSWRKNDGGIGDMQTSVTTLKWMQKVVSAAEGDIYQRQEADACNRQWRTTDGE